MPSHTLRPLAPAAPPHPRVLESARSTDVGHYIAFARGEAGIWSLFNDARVTRVTLEDVLKCEAYILLYERETEAGGASVAAAPVASDDPCRKPELASAAEATNVEERTARRGKRWR